MLSDLERYWPVAGPWAFEKATGGINNATYAVHTPDGEYFLRIYGNQKPLEKAGYEVAVLTEISAARLPFGVPAPIPGRTGELIVAIPTGGLTELAILVPAIPGAPAPWDRPDARTAFAAGEALGRLTAAFSQVRVEQPASICRYGDLDQIHPRVTDPTRTVADLSLPLEQKIQLTGLIDRLVAEVPQRYATLPQQVIHADFVPFNVMIEGNQITGILDFEFVCRDCRAMDLACGLASWPGPTWNTGGEWPILEALLRGYASIHPLTDEEIDALPFLIRLRRVVHFLHMTARYLDGNAQEEHFLNAVESAVEKEAWLAVNEAELVRRAQRCR